MSTITQLLRAMQFGDSMLPVGSFSFSNGLESAVQQRVVHDLTTLREFVLTAVQQSAASDGIALLAAFRADRREDHDEIVRADRAVFNRKLNEEMRTMSVRMGRKLGEMADRVFGVSRVSRWLTAIQKGETPGTYPVGQALVFSALALSETDAFAVHQYGVASMILGAALRLMRIDYLDAQTILFQVNATVEMGYRSAASANLEDMAAFAPLVDILAAVHVQSHVRMFMN